MSTTASSASLFRRSFRWTIPLLSILCAAGMWSYANRVLIPYQISDAAAHGRPRGNLSDLYPRWLGARELLLHGRDPYTAEITSEVQSGFYGRPLDPDRPGGQNYQQGFYYPVYVAFLLAPTLHLPFELVRKAFFWLLLVLTMASIPLWLRIVQWTSHRNAITPCWLQFSLVVLTIGSLPVMQGLKLQQITLFVVPLLAAAMALITANHPIPAGIILAIATIKPQLVWLLLFWLMLWVLADLRRRYPLAVSFLLSMAVLLAASEWYLPHWFLRFWQAAREYRSYTGEMSVTSELIGPGWSRLLELLVFVLVIAACWKERRQPADTYTFACILSLVLAATNLLVPSSGTYNQILLIPALLIMLNEREMIWQRGVASRALCLAAVFLLGWPWLSSIVLAALSFILPLPAVERGWAIPLATALQTPLSVVALMLFHYYRKTFTEPPSQSTS